MSSLSGRPRRAAAVAATAFIASFLTPQRRESEDEGEEGEIEHDDEIVATSAVGAASPSTSSRSDATTPATAAVSGNVTGCGASAASPASSSSSAAAAASISSSVASSNTAGASANPQFIADAANQVSHADAIAVVRSTTSVAEAIDALPWQTFNQGRARIGVDDTMKEIVLHFIVDDVKAVESCLSNPVTMNEYFSDRELTYMLRKAVQFSAWNCLDSMVDRCSFSSKHVRSLFEAFVDFCLLRSVYAVVGESGVPCADRLWPIRDELKADAPHHQEQLQNVLQAVQVAHVDFKRYLVRYMSKVGFRFIQESSLLEMLHQKTNGFSLLSVFLSLECPESLKSSRSGKTKVMKCGRYNTITRKGLVKFMSDGVSNLSMALPFLPSEEPLLDAVSHILSAWNLHYSYCHNEQRREQLKASVQASVSLHLSIVKNYTKCVEIFLIPDLANIVQQYLHTPWSGDASLSYEQQDTARTDILEMHFPTSTPPISRKRKQTSTPSDASSLSTASEHDIGADASAAVAHIGDSQPIASSDSSQRSVLSEGHPTVVTATDVDATATVDAFSSTPSSAVSPAEDSAIEPAVAVPLNFSGVVNMDIDDASD